MLDPIDISDYDLNKYSNLTRQSMNHYLLDYEELDTGYIEIDQQKSAWTLFKHNQGLFTLKVISYHIKKGRKGYTLTCTALENEFDYHLPVFKQIAESIEFTE